jgi:hypothetical protein
LVTVLGAWEQGVVQHTSDPEYVKEDEEEERERRLKDEGGYEQKREQVAHAVADVFKEQKSDVTRYRAQISSEQARGIAVHESTEEGPIATGGQQQASQPQSQASEEQPLPQDPELLRVVEAEEKERQDRMKPNTPEKQKELAHQLAQAMHDEQGLGPRYPEMVVPSQSSSSQHPIINIETKEESATPYDINEEKLSKVEIPDLDIKIDIKEMSK